MGARSGAADQEEQREDADRLIHERLLLATSLGRHRDLEDRTLACGYSNAKTRFQSFFMLITVAEFGGIKKRAKILQLLVANIIHTYV